MLQAVFQRARHACRQSVSMNRCWSFCCMCGSRRYRERPGRLDSSPTSTSNTSSADASSAPDDWCCGLCYWISSALSWDWLPLWASDGNSTGATGGNVGVGGDGRGGRRREGLGDVGVGGVLDGGVGGGGAAMRRVPVVADDSKPLLPESAAFETRAKEDRFMKGRFVVPGSDMQRKIAEAMAGMLAAGGRAMTGADNGNTNSNHTSSRSIASAGTGDGYREIVDDDATASDSGDNQNQSLEEQNGVLVRGGRGSGGLLSRRTSASASPRRSVGTPSEAFYVGGSGTGAARGRGGVKGPGEDHERECVICMEDFTKEDPEMLTLCSCGMNKTFFHYSCLLQWLAKHSYCPACRGYLYFEERHMGASGEASGRIQRNAAHGGRDLAASDEDYGQAFQRALRAGLDAGSSSAVNNIVEKP